MSLQGLENEKSLLIPPNDKSSVTARCYSSISKNGRTAFTAFLITIGISGLLLLLQHATKLNSNSTISRFRINFPASVHDKPITGRLLVCIAKKHAVNDPQGKDQPRLLISDSANTQQLLAVDVWNFAPGQDYRDVNVTHAVGYPILFMDQVPSDEYWIQAVLHPYVEYNRSDGWKLQLPKFTTFESEGGILTAPGTLFSAAQLATLDPKKSLIDLTLTQMEPEVPEVTEPHELLKHVTFRSPRLSAFWGTDVYLKAWVLLPHRFYDEEMKSIHYPVLIYHTHYSRYFEHNFFPTRPNNSTTTSLGEQYGYYFYSNWTSDKPTDPFTNKRGIIVQLQHANPYYDDSYAVNSANIGPYGDAITYEFLPFIEKKFRGIGEGWARAMYGGSTGGWESLAVQVYYPEEYNGCWSFCPDAFDFRRFQQVNLLKNQNAYYARGDWTQKDRGARRDYLGDIRETMAEENHHELALGSRGRSGGQWDAWQAVYSPVSTTDGYPASIWNKLTGEIHSEVVNYWETHYDVRAKLEQEWQTKGLGLKLVNKLHVYVGVTDSYYLNDAVFLLEDFLKRSTKPYYNGSIVYGITDGRGYEHCWTGSFDQSISLAWYTINQRIIPQMVDHIVQTAPKNADLSFTSY